MEVEDVSGKLPLIAVESWPVLRDKAIDPVPGTYIVSVSAGPTAMKLSESVNPRHVTEKSISYDQ